MRKTEDYITIYLHDLNSFSGLFGTSKVCEDTNIYGVGVVKDPEKLFFIIRTLGPYGAPMNQLMIDASQKGVNQWIRFLFESTPQGLQPIICTEVDFLKFLITNNIPTEIIGRLTDLVLGPREIRAQIKPIANGMVRAYLNILHDSDPSLPQVATFLAKVACDTLTYQFLTLTGMVHSAQDIIYFIKNKLSIDIVYAGIPDGAEIFILGKTDKTPVRVSPSDFGIDYFSTISRYKHLLQPYRIKLALISVCKKYHLRLGYRVSWNSKEKMEDKSSEKHF